MIKTRLSDDAVLPGGLHVPADNEGSFIDKLIAESRGSDVAASVRRRRSSMSPRADEAGGSGVKDYAGSPTAEKGHWQKIEQESVTDQTAPRAANEGPDTPATTEAGAHAFGA